ncbi:MAG: HAD family hydrolase [Anaerolineae bacterium]|nr:HAD family hydrolase [Anaerolineae bacterium]
MTTLTVLLDLDNTLLGNDMNHFLPPYAAALQKHLKKFTDEQDLWPMLVASVQVMQANQDPTVTNHESFYRDFTRRLGLSYEVIQPSIDVFYHEDFPQLQPYTTRRPQAQAVVRRLLADGHQVVIATSPLFPAQAIEQRMAWAGVDGFPYALVTTMENSHYSKPNPAYYREILSKTNSSPETTWMVGDDVENDIIPAHALGLSTWWITPERAIDIQPPPACDRQGTLADFLAWLEAGGLSGPGAV